MKIKELYISPYSTPDSQTVVIKTEDGKTVEVDLYDATSKFLPNQVRIKTYRYEWGHTSPVVTEFGHPFED